MTPNYLSSETLHIRNKHLDNGIRALVIGYGDINAHHVELMIGSKPATPDVVTYIMSELEAPNENAIINSLGRLAREGEIVLTTQKGGDKLNPHTDIVSVSSAVSE